MLPPFKIHSSNRLCCQNDGQNLIMNSELVQKINDENAFVYSVRQDTSLLHTLPLKCSRNFLIYMTAVETRSQTEITS